VGRIRKLAKVVPFGMETPLLVSELVPPLSACRELTDEHLQTYDQAVDAFIDGKWEEAYRLLHMVPNSDRAQDFLTLEIARTGRVAPPAWDGVVNLPAK
jgi:adenylate cyclase